MNDKPCIKCGSTKRSTPTRGRKTGSCIACARVSRARLKADGPLPVKDYPNNDKPCIKCGCTVRNAPPPGKKMGRCRACAESRFAKWKHKNRTKYLAGCAKWNANNKGYMDKWRADNQDHIKQYQIDNYERKKVTALKWRRKNIDKVRASVVRRRARRRNAFGNITAREWTSLVRHYGGVCLCCGKSEITMDHIVPLSRGGDHTIENVQPLCQLCNNKKFTKTIDYRPDAGPKYWIQTGLELPTD